MVIQAVGCFGEGFIIHQLFVSSYSWAFTHGHSSVIFLLECDCDKY